MKTVLDLLDYQPRTRRGAQWRGPCPVHRSSSQSHCCFAVHLGKQVYHCFRCGASGNQLELYGAVTRQDLYPAALDLCRRLGITVPWLGTNHRPRQENATRHES